MNPKLEAYIQKTVSEAPPLTDSQRDRIAGLLDRRTLADALPAPDDVSARRILALLTPDGSEPMRVKLDG